MHDWLQSSLIYGAFLGFGIRLGQLRGLSALTSVGTLLFLFAWIYAVHWASHYVFPKDGPWLPINIHYWIHHSKPKPFPRPVELLLEGISDFFGAASLILFQKLAGVRWLDTAIILYFSIIYASAHIVNQSIFGSERHKQHHLQETVNFGPDIADAVLGTRWMGPQVERGEIFQILNVLASYGIVSHLSPRLK